MAKKMRTTPPFVGTGLFLVGCVAVAALPVVGCFSDQPLDIIPDSGAPSDSAPVDTSPDSNGTDGNSGTDTSSDGPIQTYAEDYVNFDAADDTWAPQGLTPPELTETHTGWYIARCHDCHATQADLIPAGHNPEMQYWAWSCARGFPGSVCHGHGGNGAILFNHSEDPYFAYCTRVGCHDSFNVRKDRENHGMNEVPSDAFCNACHQATWGGWPVTSAK